MSPGSAEDVPGFKFPAKTAGRHSWGFSRVLPGYSTVFSPGLNFSREQRLHSKRSHLNNRYIVPTELHFWEGPPPAENYTFSQKPTAHWIEKKTTAPPPPQKYSALPSKPPPPRPRPTPPQPHIFSSGSTLSCCVLVYKNTCTVYLMPKAPWWEYVSLYVWTINSLDQLSAVVFCCARIHVQFI